MRTVIVASTAPYSGKSGISLAMLAALGERGHATGYFKPYGTMPVTVNGIVTDEDAFYITRNASAAASIEMVCGVVETRAFVEGTLDDDPGDLSERVTAAFAAASRNATVMVVEGTSSLAQARTVGLNLCPMAELLDAQVLLVDRPQGLDLPDNVLWASDCLGERLLGVVFNAVSESHFDFIAEDVTRFLTGRGVPVLGTLRRDPLLSSVTVAEIVEALGGMVLCAESALAEPVETFMVGAMGQEKALRFFRRKARKAVITGGDRPDVQLAALETDTRCIVLTGNLPPSSLVLARAEELGVPMVLVGMDTLSAVETMESLLGRVHLHDVVKADRIREMFCSAVDVDKLVHQIVE
ncbi:MAG: phosphotransacetylase family protein [Actinomycetota bacterium]|nr:phosphotransacetylase family protein [Actinomycetota bacterium]